MSQNAQEQLFKTIANQIVGSWYYADRQGGLIFSLCPSYDATARIRIFGDNESSIALYSLAIAQNNEPVIKIADFHFETELTVKVLLKDTLVMQQYPHHLHILERRVDTSFVNAIIEKIEADESIL